MPTLPGTASKSLPPASTTEDPPPKAVVTEALRGLSPAHREVLNETILRGRTVNDAAAALGIPVGTVKSRVYYALYALRAALAERGIPPATAAGCP
jgi:RNA polymerase sigma-70 factor (ECF subfamily)